MNHSTNIDETPDECVARQHRMLKRLAEIGMTLAEDIEDRALEARAAGEKDPGAVGERGMAFNRISRAVRLTIAQQGRVEEGALLREKLRRSLDADKLADARRGHVHAAKRNVIATFREAVELGVDRDFLDHAERLMESEAYDDDLAELPFTEALAIVANDLGGDFNPKTFGKPIETTDHADQASAFPDPALDPMHGANAIEDEPTPRAPPTSNGLPAGALAKAGHDPP